MINHNILRRARASVSKGGQTLVEYAITLALISVVAIGAMINMGGQVQGVFSTVSSQLALSGNAGVNGSGGSGNGTGGDSGGTGSTGGTGGTTHPR